VTPISSDSYTTLLDATSPLREPVKRCTWSHVAFLQLREDTPALVIDDLE